MKCRFCAAELEDVFLDLGTAPPSNAFLSAAELVSPEIFYPLKLLICRQCLLIQVDEVRSAREIFSADYVYFSSFSRSWVAHAEAYVERAVERLALNNRSFVVEIASNDGYLLQFVSKHGIPCLGIEPTAGTAKAAEAKGIETVVDFFGRDFAGALVRNRRQADLLVANNVLAHVPNLNDFVSGLALALAPEGTLTVEFPHLLELIRNQQFDTVYHEHFSYFSLRTAMAVFAAHGLRVWDVERIPTHGGSLRLWLAHSSSLRDQQPEVSAVLDEEFTAGMQAPSYYEGFQEKAEKAKNNLLAFLIEQQAAGRRVVGYGAAAKGNTLLNFAGVRSDLLRFVADSSPYKQEHFLPGSHIPVVSEVRIRVERPDFILILPWNLRAEITEQLDYIREWGGRFVTAIPSLEVL